MLTVKETYWRNVGVGSVIMRDEVGRPTYSEDERWGWMLVDIAVGAKTFPCDDPTGRCEVCDMTAEWWVRKILELPRYVAMAVDRTLIRHEIPRPTVPLMLVEE